MPAFTVSEAVILSALVVNIVLDVICVVCRSVVQRKHEARISALESDIDILYETVFPGEQSTEEVSEDVPNQ